MVKAGKLEGKARFSQCKKENYKTLMGGLSGMYDHFY